MPRDEERPLLEDDKQIIPFDDEDEDDPMNWSFSYKVLTTILFSLTTLGCTFTSSVFSSAQDKVAEEFDITILTATLGTSLYVLAYAFGPLAFAPASEFLGRKRPLVFGYAIFALTQILVATAKNTSMILVGRALGGFFSSAPLAIMSGAMADIWNNEQRGIAIAIFSSVNFIGPVAGPLVGSILVNKYDWRSVEWLVCVYAGTMALIDAIFISETYAAVILKSRAMKIREETGNQKIMAELEKKKLTIGYVFEAYFSRPIKMLCLDPISLSFAFLTAFTFGILYLSFIAFPIEYKKVRGWTQVQAALPNIGIIIGVLCGLAACVWYQPRYNAALKKNDGEPVPEMRLPLLVAGTAVFPVGLLIFGLTAAPEIHWIGGVIGITLIGFGIYMIFFPSLNYIVDAYLKYTASAVAANTLLRSIFGAAFPLFGRQLFEGLGVKVGSLILAAIALLLFPISIFFLKYGERMRKMSRFAPTD